VEPLELVRLVLRYLHLVGFALLLGSFVVQYVSGRMAVHVLMRVGLGTALVTGLLLAIPFPAGIDLDYVKLGVKLGIALAIGPIMGIAITRGTPVNRTLFTSIGLLVLVNAGVAVFWR
jgi:hypothetical protein